MPFANYLLCIGAVAVSAAFNNTTSLGNAYGVCVIFVTFFDTFMVMLASVIVWRFPPYLVIVPWLTIACMDGAFLSSALTKVPSGAWFTFTMAVVLASFFILWRYGKEQQWTAEAQDRQPTSHFIKADPEGGYRLSQTHGGEKLSVIRGVGIFFDKGGNSAPLVFSQFTRKFAAVPEVAVFFHMRPLEKPSVPSDEQFTVTPMALPNCYRVVLRHGYMDDVAALAVAANIFREVRLYVAARQHTIGAPSAPKDEGQTLSEGTEATPDPIQPPQMPAPAFPTPRLHVHQLDEAYQHRVLYVSGKEEMIIRAGAPWYRRALLRAFLFVRHNTRTKMANLNVPTDQLVEIGFVKEL